MLKNSAKQDLQLLDIRRMHKWQVVKQHKGWNGLSGWQFYGKVNPVSTCCPPIGNSWTLWQLCASCCINIQFQSHQMISTPTPLAQRGFLPRFSALLRRSCPKRDDVRPNLSGDMRGTCYRTGVFTLAYFWCNLLKYKCQRQTHNHLKSLLISVWGETTKNLERILRTNGKNNTTEPWYRLPARAPQDSLRHLAMFNYMSNWCAFCQSSGANT